MTVLIAVELIQTLNPAAFSESGGDGFGASDGGAHHYGVGAQNERLACLHRVRDMAFYDDRYCQVRQDGLDEQPGDGALTCGLGGVAVEGGGDSVGSCAFGGDGVLEGSDVGEDGAIELSVDAADEFGPGFSGGEPASGAVEGDDVGSCVADGLGAAKVWGDVDIAVCVVSLDDADDREFGEVAEGCDARNAFSAKTACTAAKNRGCDAGEGVEIVERVTFAGLNGDDELSAKGVDG